MQRLPFLFHRPGISISRPLLCALLLAGSIGAAQAMPPPARVAGLFHTPSFTRNIPADRWVLLTPKAVLVHETAAVAPSRVQTPGSIALPAGFGTAIAAGTVFTEELGPDGRAACLHRRTPRGASVPPPLCLTDSDGDGRIDRAERNGKTARIAPVQLRPAADVPTTHPGAATIERRIFVGSIDATTVTLDGDCMIRPGGGLPRYNVSSTGRQATPIDGLVLPLRHGQRVTASGLTLEVRRATDGVWWIRISGESHPWVWVRDAGTKVVSPCGTLEAMR
jgi:hypothetical protein